MAKLALFFAATIGCAFALPTAPGAIPPPPVTNIDPEMDWRIVGGSTASNGQFPYQVSLRNGNSHFCGGTILSSTWILTAAHCLQGTSPSSVSVVVGTNTLNSGGTRYAAARIINHQSYNPNTMANDIALVRTAQTISFNNFVSAAQMSNTNVGAGIDLVLSGWGTTSYPGSAPNNLQYANLKSISNQQCQQAHTSAQINAGQICTFTRRGQGACHGDSGGPLASGNVVVGVVSWGRPCAIGYPDVFTRVAQYVSWIQSNANN